MQTITGVSFGVMGSGKTVDAWRAFPMALCLGVPSAIKTVALSVAGYEPEAVWPWVPRYTNDDPTRGEFLRYDNLAKMARLPEQIRHTADQMEILHWLAEPEQGWIKSQFGTVIYDDQALIDALWVADMRRRFDAGDVNVPRTRNGAFDVRGTYGLLNEMKLDMSDLTRHLGMNYWVTTHLIEAGTNEQGESWGTGPNLGSKKQMDRVPAWIEFCYWLKAADFRQVLDPWHQAIYHVEKSEAVKTKDRSNICWRSTPANIRAILRASSLDVDLRRIPGLEWQDEVMEEIAEVTADSGLDRTAIAEVMTRIFKERGDIDFIPESPETPELKHIQWALSDGLALGTIRHRQRTSPVPEAWLKAGAAAASGGGTRPRPGATRKAG